MSELFDMELRALRRDRAARRSPNIFLLERTFDDCLDRLSLMNLRFDSVLLIGCPDARWPDRLLEFASRVDVADPGACFAAAAGGRQIAEDAWTPEAATYDLILAVGTLDTVNDLPHALVGMRTALRPGSLLLGAMSGADTLPRLRSAMRAADALTRQARPHVHPRIEAASLATLLATTGFVNPVVDVDRVPVSYPGLDGLVSDLRAMAASNILSQRSRVPLSKAAYAIAKQDFTAAGEGGRTTETYELLHFACWSPGPGKPADG